MTLLSFGWLALTLLAGDTPPTTPVLDKLAAEAEALKTKEAGKWKQYQEQAKKVFADNEKAVAEWQKRSAPPRPELESLKLPLPFLMESLRQEEGKEETPIPRQGLGVRAMAYLRAAARSADPRRFTALQEYRRRFEIAWADKSKAYPWGPLLAEAATPQEASVLILAAVKQNPPPAFGQRPDNLLYSLMNRFAKELPPDVRDPAYQFVHRHAPNGPVANLVPLWDLLLRLDPARARKEVVTFFDKAPPRAVLRYNQNVISLLAKHPGPSPEVADAVRHWLADRKDIPLYQQYTLRVVLLRADPEHELEPAAKFIDQTLVEQKQNETPFEYAGPVHQLLLAMGEVEPKAAEDYQARYALTPEIPAGVRLLVLESLVRRHSPKAPELVARWLTTEDESYQTQLRKQASEKWGAYGKEVLAEAEKLNTKKGS